MSLLQTLFYKSLGYGRLRSQRFFAKLHSQAIHGMNYSDPVFETNGELGVMRTVQRKLAARSVAKPVIFDVGANVGSYASALNGFFPAADIHCFEPSRRTCEELRKRTGGKENITVHEFGFGEAESSFTLFSDAPFSKTASVYDLPKDHFWKGEITETIQLRTIDAFSGESGIDRIHFLKLDIEGHEFSALKGAAGLRAAGKIDFIQFEFGFRQIDSRGYFRDFFQLLHPQYSLYRILKDGLFPIEKYHEGLEIFVLAGNFLAELRSQPGN